METEPYEQGSTSVVQTGTDANLIMQTNPERIVEEIEHTLKCEVFDHQRQKWVQKPGSTPFLNDVGLAAIITAIRGKVNQNTILSNLTEKEIQMLMIHLSDEIIGLIAMRYQEYEIDKAHLTLLVNLIEDMCFLALKRCLNQGERQFLKTTVQSHEKVVITPQEPKSKMSGFSFFKPNK